MEEIIKEIVDSIWEFIKDISALVFIIFIFSLLMFLVLRRLIWLLKPLIG